MNKKHIIGLIGGILIVLVGVFVVDSLGYLDNLKFSEINQEMVHKEKDDEVIENNEIDTSNWETYRNQEHGLEMKYPGDWRRIEDSLKENGLFFVRFSTDGTKTNGDALGNIKKNWAMIEVIRQDLRNRKADKGIAEEDRPAYYKTITVDGIELKEEFGVRYFDIVVSIPKCGYTYQIDLVSTSVKYYEPIFNGVLSSLEILCTE